jgi:hypothetical protein
VEDTTTATATLGQVGPRLKQLRARRGVTLTRTLGGVQAWFGSTGARPAEILSMFGPQGEGGKPE